VAARLLRTKRIVNLLPFPQAFAYANGRPLVASDPSGRYALYDPDGCKSGYPHVYDFVQQSFPQNGANSQYAKIFNDMFGAASHFWQSGGADYLKKGCAWNDGPTLIIDHTKGAAYAETALGRTVLNVDVAKKIEKDPSSLWFLNVVLLHELAHYANQELHGNWDPPEAGDEFERRAFGTVYQMQVP
jgi:hypothetical protein